MVSGLKDKWAECLGNPAPQGSGMLATAEFKNGMMRVMILHPEEREIMRHALNTVAMRTERVEVDD